MTVRDFPGCGHAAGRTVCDLAHGATPCQIRGWCWIGTGIVHRQTLLERSGASVTTANAEPPATGARVVVTWPRQVFERARLPSVAPAISVRGSEKAA